MSSTLLYRWRAILRGENEPNRKTRRAPSLKPPSRQVSESLSESG